MTGVVDVGHLCLSLKGSDIKVVSVYGAFEVLWLLELEEGFERNRDIFTYGDGVYSIKCTCIGGEDIIRWKTEVVGFTSLHSLAKHGTVGEGGSTSGPAH